MTALWLPGALFAATLALVIWQPRGLKIGTSAVLGAMLALLLGLVSLADVWQVTQIVWDATLAFIGIIVISMVLDELGFFEWAAIKMAHWSSGNGHLMFIYTLLLGALVAAFFANDGAALILTPIILAKMRLLQLNLKSLLAFALAAGFISDAASLPFVFSNLTNIVTVNYFEIGFWAYAQVMWLPNLVAVAVSVLLLWGLFYRDLPKRIDLSQLKPAKEAIKHPAMFRWSLLVLLLIFVGMGWGDTYGLPISLFALGGALVLLLMGHYFGTCKAWLTLKIAPWQIVWFSIGLYVVVWGLKNAGLTDWLALSLHYFAAWGSTAQIVATGFLAAVLSALMNNLPTVMVMDIAIAQTQQAGQAALAYANIIGSNLGPKMTPWGSLATLLWLHVLMQKGVAISWRQYMLYGVLLTPPVLLVTLLALAWSM
ncbi:MAG: arsenical efflux pump membrane protein ArsB [Gammaproteobacteria bacterium]|nr:arsenical efflux pump membrane protein ArsB [Gammaproteobacteria bacterium]